MSKLTERQQLRFAEFFIVALVLLLILSPGQKKHWPFVYWDLYSRENPQVPQSASRTVLRVLDIGNQWHWLRSMDIYTLDDDTSKQSPGRNLIQGSFESNSQQRQYRSTLVIRLEEILGSEVETVEAWQLTWNVNFDSYPPLQFAQPETTKKIGSFQAVQYTVEQK